MAINRSASEVLGPGASGGGLEKLAIWYNSGKLVDSIEALFNPTEINLSRAVKWMPKKRPASGNAPWHNWQQDFISVGPETLEIQLFFDTYESHEPSFTVPANPRQSTAAKDVRKYTRRLSALARVDREWHEPPLCRLAWGNETLFVGVLTSLKKNFSMFMPDGTPVRATVDCTFVEYETKAAQRKQELHSADVAKSRTVRSGDTLHSLAAEEYNDPSLWRHIARANHIINPRDLKSGTVLIIPPLQP